MPQKLTDEIVAPLLYILWKPYGDGSRRAGRNSKKLLRHEIMSSEHMLFAADLALEFDQRITINESVFLKMSDQEKKAFFQYYLSAIGGMMCAYIGSCETVSALEFVADRIGKLGLPVKNEVGGGT